MRSTRTSAVRRRLLAVGTTLVLASGLGAGVASASSTAAAPTAGVESSAVGTKAATGQLFDCNLFPSFWFCQ